MHMWRPIVERGDGAWLGTTGDGQLWVGGLEAANSPVPLTNPVFLWPLLERPLAQTVGLLFEHWDEFDLAGDVSPRNLAELIARSAVDAGRPYWVDHALGWLEAMVQDPRFGREGIVSTLELALRVEGLPQATRHRAQRIKRMLADE